MKTNPVNEEKPKKKIQQSDARVQRAEKPRMSKPKSKQISSCENQSI